jgi:hypothetical protein
MMSRRDLLTWSWWRRPAPEPPRPPPPACVVDPVWIETAGPGPAPPVAPFSLEAFYAARAAERRS